MSHHRGMMYALLPTAAIWRASEYRLVGDPLGPDYIEAKPTAVWSRMDPFETYSSVGDRAPRNESEPHVAFMKLANMALEFAPTDEELKLFHVALHLFAHHHGLLGLFREEFGAPLLPEREVGWFVRVAPDAVIDGSGRLRAIDPTTQGKRLLEELLRERDRQVFAARGEPHLWEPEKVVLTQEMLILPGGLRFQRQATDFLRSGFSQPFSSGPDHSRVFTYDEVKRRYGVCVVFDQQAVTGVSILSTREPVGAWRDELRAFAQPRSRGRLNRHLESVNPREVDDEEGRTASSWRCPSLLKALWLMRHLDATARVRLQRCQAPNCYEYFRVGPHERPRKYCRPSPGQKQSKCATRASSAMYRERERGKS